MGLTNLKTMTSSTEQGTKDNVTNINEFGISYDDALALIKSERLPTYYSGSGTYTVSFDSSIVHQYHRLAGGTTATVFNSATATGLSQGYLIEFKDRTNNAASSNITITLSGSDTFADGTTSKTITTSSGFLGIRYAGSNIWDVVGKF